MNYILRLNAPIPDSAHVYGVADYQQELEHHQIYLHLSQVGVVEGPVYICKTPALRVSDFRLFQAVKKEGLSHLHDVVVFSTSIGDEVLTTPTALMSSADLDGDHF